MNLAKVSANGQITVPVEIRRLLGLRSGDKVLFFQRQDGDVVISNASAQALRKAQLAFVGAAEEMGIIPGPEIGESDVRLNKGKFIVIGTESLWKYISETEVGDIVNTHYFTYNSDAACQD